MDRRFLERKLLVGNKRIKYFHKVPIFQEALNEASWQLNPVGIKLLFECIKLAEKCWESMQMEDQGILETFSNGQTKVYHTSGVDCDCSYYRQMFFCRHIIFSRVNLSLPIFDQSVFHSCLLKDCSSSSDQQIYNQENSDFAAPLSPGMNMVLSENKKKRRNPSQSKKFNTALDVGREMAEILSSYDLDTFNESLEAVQLFLKQLRRGGVDPRIMDLLKSPTGASASESTNVGGIHQMEVDDNVRSSDGTSRDCLDANDNVSGSMDCNDFALSIHPTDEDILHRDNYSEAAASNTEVVPPNHSVSGLETFSFYLPQHHSTSTKDSRVVKSGHSGIRNEVMCSSVPNSSYASKDRPRLELTDMNGKSSKMVFTVVSNVNEADVYYRDEPEKNNNDAVENSGLIGKPVPSEEGLVDNVEQVEIEDATLNSNVHSDEDSNESMDELPDLVYTPIGAKRAGNDLLTFEKILRCKGRSKKKREKGIRWSVDDEPKMKKTINSDRPLKQRKERSDKGKKRGAYKVKIVTESNNVADDSSSPLSVSRAPKNAEALRSEFGSNVNPAKCYTCNFPLNYDATEDDEEGEMVVKCPKCMCPLHASCLKNCGFCEQFEF